MSVMTKLIDLANLHICFIDNEEDERTDIRDSLRNFGNTSNWVVEDYSDEIIQKSINNEFDILVCDYKMPGKNGITVLEEVRKKIIKSFLPFLLHLPFQNEVMAICVAGKQ